MTLTPIQFPATSSGAIEFLHRCKLFFLAKVSKETDLEEDGRGGDRGRGAYPPLRTLPPPPQELHSNFALEIRKHLIFFS